MTNWREEARSTIWNTLKQNGINSGRDALSLSEKDKQRIIKAVSEAYPFGLRENHPYKIWCSEVNAILSGLMIKKSTSLKPRVLIDNPRQMRFL